MIDPESTVKTLSYDSNNDLDVDRNREEILLIGMRLNYYICCICIYLANYVYRA